MARLPSEDYFANTSMTFGEHLEELRAVLAKAGFGLLIGFLVGLAVANQVVRFIESPLRRALTDFYAERDISELEAKFGPERVAEVAELIREQRMTFTLMLIEKDRLRELAANLDQPGMTDVSRLRREAGEVPPPVGEFEQIRVWQPVRTKITALNAQEAFMIWLKAGFVTGLVLASPYMFFQLWSFVAAGLYPHEQRYIYIYLPFSLLLFLAGASLAFFFVFDPVLDFLFAFNQRMNIDPDPRISEWISFVLFLPLGFGVAFQLPLLMLFLNRIGIFSVEAYLSSWRVSVLVIFVLSMFLTPADPISMMLMAAPLSALYFLGIALSFWMPRSKNPFAEAEAE